MTFLDYRYGKMEPVTPMESLKKVISGVVPSKSNNNFLKCAEYPLVKMAEICGTAKQAQFLRDEIKLKWNQMINKKPLNELKECFVLLHRLTPEEIRMHTRSSKKRTAVPIKTREKLGTAGPPSAKRFKRIVLPHDNSDEDENSDSPCESGSKKSSQIGKVRSLSLDCESERNIIRKSKQSSKYTCQGMNQQLCRTDFQNGKRLNIEKKLPDSCSNKDSSCGFDGSKKSLVKNLSNKGIENKLSKLDPKRKLNCSTSNMCVGAKNKLSKTLCKEKSENNAKPALIFPSRAPDRTLLIENRGFSCAKQSLKTPGKQQSSPVLSTNKDEIKKLNRLSLSSGFGNNVIEKVSTPSKVDDKLKHFPINNEKAQHSLKVNDKSGTASKVIETTVRQQEESVSTVVHDQSLKAKCSTQASVIVAESIEDLMDEYEQLTTPSLLVCKHSAEKRNDKKLSQKKMLNMFGEEHLVEDSQSIYQSPSISFTDKEKLLFPDLALISNQFDNAKKIDAVPKVKHAKLNCEADFNKSKDENLLKDNTKKRKLSEPIGKEKIDKSRRHSVDAFTEKSSKAPNSISSGKNLSTNCQKKASNNLTVISNDLKNSSGNKSISLSAQNCATACTVAQSNKVSDLENNNSDSEKIKKTKQVKVSDCMTEKFKHLENRGKKDLELKKSIEKSDSSLSRSNLSNTSKNCETSENKKFNGLEENLYQLHQEKSGCNRRKEHGAVVSNDASKIIEKENFCENKKAHSSSVKDMPTKNKTHVLYNNMEKNKITSVETVKVTSTDNSRQKATCDNLKKQQNLCDNNKHNLNEKGNSEKSEEIVNLGRLNNDVSTTEVVSSSSAVNNIYNNDSDVRTFQLKNSSNTPSKLAENIHRSPLCSSLNEKDTVVQPIENLMDECSSLSVEEELQRLEQVYESLDKWVDDVSTKKLLILQRMESLQGIEVVQKVKQEVTDEDDDCEVIFSSDWDTSTMILKDENDSSSSVATEVLDLPDGSSISLPNEDFNSNGSTTLVNSSTVIVDGSALAYKVGNGETLTGSENIRLINSVAVDNSVSEPPQIVSGKSVTNSSFNIENNSSETCSHSTTRGQSEHILGDCNTKSVSSSVEVSKSVPHRNGEDCGDNLNKVVCSSEIVQESTNVQKTVPEQNMRDSQDKRNFHSVGESSKTTLKNNTQVSVDENSVSDQCPGKHLSAKTVITKIRESNVAACSVSPDTQTSASKDNGHSVPVQEDRIRVRGIDDLIARPNESVVPIDQSRESANAIREYAFLNGYFSNQEGVIAFLELIKVMVVLGKAAESYIQLTPNSVPSQQTRPVLTRLIAKHCVLVYRLCKKSISSFKENPDYFLNILFMQMVTKWQGPLGVFSLQHLKVLLKSCFQAVLKFHQNPAFHAHVHDILAKIKVSLANPKQVHSSMQNISETSGVAQSSQQSHVSNVIVSNNSSSQTQLISVPSSENPAVIAQRERLNVPVSSQHSFASANAVPSREEWNQPVSGQSTLQSEISSTTGQTNPTYAHYQGQHMINAPQMNNQTHSTVAYGTIPNNRVNADPIYRPPPPYSSIAGARQNPHQLILSSMLANRTPNYNVPVVTQKNTPHIHKMLQMTKTVQMRIGNECVPQTMLNQALNASSTLQHQTQNPTNVSSTHRVMPTSSSLSNVSASGQCQLPQNNYQLPQTHRLSYQVPYIQKTNMASQQNPANAISVQESNSNVHPNQRNLLQAYLQTPASQHNPVVQRISLMASTSNESNSLNQQPVRRPSFEEQFRRESNAVNRQQPIVHNAAVDVPSLRESSSTLQQQHPPVPRPSVDMSSLREPGLLQQHPPAQGSSGGMPSSRVPIIMQQQHPVPRPSVDMSSLREPSLMQQHPPAQGSSGNTSSSRVSIVMQQHPVPRPSVDMSSLREPGLVQQHPPTQGSSGDMSSSRVPIVMQQHPPVPRPSVDMSSLRDSSLMHHQHRPVLGSSVSMFSLRDPSGVHQQQLSVQRPSADMSRESNVIQQHHTQNQSYNPSSSKVSNQPLPSASQRPTFIASSIRDSTHQLQLQNQVQVLRSSNLVENCIGIPKDTCCQTSRGDPKCNNCNASELCSAVRVTQAPEWNQNIGTSNKEIFATTDNNNTKRNYVVTQMKKSKQGVVHWYGQAQQTSNHFNINVAASRGAAHLNVHQNIIAPRQISQTTPNEHNTIPEHVKDKFPVNVKSPDRSIMKLNYSESSVHQNVNNTQQLVVEQYTSRPSIIHTVSQKIVEIHNTNEHITPVLDQLHSNHKSSSRNILQVGLHSSTIYDSNEHTKNVRIGSHFYNNATMNYAGKVDAGSCTQPLVPSLASPVYGNSPGSLPEEYDQMRVQAMGRSLSRDSGYRSPSQGAESYRDSFVYSHGKCYVCHKEAILTCSRCISVYYCNNDCQVGDWPRHKSECKESN